jgi:hypothetical protein
VFRIACSGLWCGRVDSFVLACELSFVVVEIIIFPNFVILVSILSICQNVSVTWLVSSFYSPVHILFYIRIASLISSMQASHPPNNYSNPSIAPFCSTPVTVHHVMNLHSTVLGSSGFSQSQIGVKRRYIRNFTRLSGYVQF